MGLIMDINSLVIFFKVAETNSLTKASKILEFPVSTVSRKIKKLEEDLGSKLFHRTTRHISLTQEGKLLYERAKPHFDELETVGNELAGSDDHLRGEIRITAPVEKRNYLVNLISKFRKHYPNISLHMNFSNDLHDLVQDSFDFAFRVGNLNDSNLFYHIIGQEKLVAYIHKNFMPHRINFESLSEFDYFVMEKNTFLETVEGNIFKPENKIASNSIEFILEMSKIIPSIIYVPEAEANNDFIKINVFKEIIAPFQIIYLSKQQNKICKAFLDFVKQH